MFRSAVKPWETISWVALRVRVATIATPQESRSCVGSYKPCADGTVENKVTKTPKNYEVIRDDNGPKDLTTKYYR
jgi:hypothetical protein